MKLSVTIPSQKDAATSVMTDVSSCTVYQYSIVPRVVVSTVTLHPYAPLKLYRAIFTFSFTPWNKNYTESYKCTQVLTVQMVTSGHIRANTSTQTYYIYIYICRESYIYFLIIQMLNSYFDHVRVDLVGLLPSYQDLKVVNYFAQWPGAIHHLTVW